MHKIKTLRELKFSPAKILMLLFVLFGTFSARAQDARITLTGHNIAIKQAFGQIEVQSGFTIAYNQTRFDDEKKISVTIRNESLDKALTEILRGTGFTYKINGKHIVITPGKENKKEKTSKQEPQQTIRGVVTDEASSVPIPYVSVVLLNTDPQRGTVTDSLGQFRFTELPVGRYDIQTSSIGYEAAIIREILLSSAKEAFCEVSLKEHTLNIDEVVVRPTINKEKPLNPMTLAGGRMLSVEEASRYAGGFDDPARLVSSFAGVAGNVSTNAISIRGNSPQFLQWKLEGVEIPNPTHFADMIGVGGGLFSALSSQVMGNSDFLNGAFTAEYSNALSGVFDMTMRNGNNEKYEHTFQAGLLGFDFASEGPLSRKNKSSYLFNYRYSTTGIMGALADNMNIAYQDFSFKLNVPTRKAGTFSLWGIGLSDANKSDITSDKTQWETYADREKSKTKMAKAAGGITHKYLLNNSAYIKTSLAATYTDNHPQIDQLLSGSESQYQTMVDMKNTNWDIVFNSYLNTKLSPKHTNRTGITITGLQYNLDFNISPEFGLDKPMEKIAKGNGFSTVASAFSSSVITLNDHLTANFGLTAQLFTLNNNWAIEPRVGIKWNIVSNQSVAIAYGLHSRREKLDYYYIQTPETGDKNVNKNLDFARAHHVVLAYDCSISPIVHLKVEPYFQYLFDVPVEQGTSFSIINHADYYLDRQLVNGGKGRNYGVDITLERYLSKGYYGMFTGSVFKSEYSGGDHIWRDTRNDRRFIFNVLGGKEWKCGKQNQNIFSTNIRLSYQGGDRYTPVDEIASLEKKNIIYDETQAFSKQYLPALTSDLNISYRMNKKRVSHEFALQILNLTGYTGQHGYQYNEQSQKIEKIEVIGILPNISYKIQF